MSSHNDINNHPSHSSATRLIRRVTTFLPSSIGQCFLPRTQGRLEGQGQVTVTIDILSDDDLLEIFASYLAICIGRYCGRSETWEPLVRVCRRWRHIVFASPRRLDLQICCTGRIRAKDMLDIWPTLLPIMILDAGPVDRWYPHTEVESANNIIAALEYRDRICDITLLHFSRSHVERLASVMLEPLPALTNLRLHPFIDTRNNEPAAVFPEEFLGGSAPSLRRCELCDISFPGIWNLLLTSHHLVRLILYGIPHPDYISPDAMATHLSAMHNLEDLSISFRSPQSRPYPPIRRPPPPTRVVLPTLTRFYFHGVSEYAEDLVSRIHSPLLNSLSITFFNQLIFDVPQLRDFLSRAELLKAHQRGATVCFMRGAVKICDELQFRVILTQTLHLELSISCEGSDWQLSAMAQLCNLPLPPFSELEHLKITNDSYGRQGFWPDDMEESQWLELLHPFSALKTLTLDKVIAPHVALALQGIAGETVINVLPVLQRLSVSRQISADSKETITGFVTARALSGHSIVVDWFDFDY